MSAVRDAAHLLAHRASIALAAGTAMLALAPAPVIALIVRTRKPATAGPVMGLEFPRLNAEKNI
jgi:hypothetical protein